MKIRHRIDLNWNKILWRLDLIDFPSKSKTTKVMIQDTRACLIPIWPKWKYNELLSRKCPNCLDNLRRIRLSNRFISPSGRLEFVKIFSVCTKYSCIFVLDNGISFFLCVDCVISNTGTGPGGIQGGQDAPIS